MGSIETNVVSGYGYEVGVEVVGESGVVRTAPPGGAVVRRDFAASQRIEDGWLDRFHTAYVIEVSSGSPRSERGTDRSRRLGRVRLARRRRRLHRLAALGFSRRRWRG
jgi:hypothetical protein